MGELIWDTPPAKGPGEVTGVPRAVVFGVIAGSDAVQRAVTLETMTAQPVVHSGPSVYDMPEQSTRSAEI